MKVCLIAEGCYPYVVGGVSGWIHSVIKMFPDIEFSLVTILSDRNLRAKFTYELPENLVSVTEVYLNDSDWGSSKNRRLHLHLNNSEKNALRSLVFGQDIKWGDLFKLFHRRKLSIDHLLMSPVFFDIAKDYYKEHYPNLTFTDFLWSMRSIYLPLFMTLKCDPPQADIYHCVSTGYAGIIGGMAKMLHPASSLIISEHGIYTREREEEIIKAKWVQGIYKDIWIEQFHKMSKFAYNTADVVTSLFKTAHDLQIDLGCPKEKALITPNGIDTKAFDNLVQKSPDDDFINVGAFLRVTPIKDVKTMINAFYNAHKKNPKLKLWIMGPDNEEPEYAEECRQLVAALKAENIIFTGRIKTTEYIGKMDMTLLTSISEGQPLTILESFAAKKPCIATNVGNCYGLIHGESDDYGAAGIIVPVLNIKSIANAILLLADDENLRIKMGEIGYRRLMEKYKIEHMKDTYTKIYTSLVTKNVRTLSADTKANNQIKIKVGI
jgi:glycosyltransferase involved in cell wall biosynthesis